MCTISLFAGEGPAEDDGPAPIGNFRPPQMPGRCGTPVTAFRPPRVPGAYRGKRTLDLFLSLTFGLIILPVVLLIACAVRLTMGGPVFFRQRRPGFAGRVFSIVKFRTMTDRLGPDGLIPADAERLTRLGRFLRKTSLDELPELWNVIRGEMSLVGPRPLLPEYQPFYSARERLRFTVLPGITGLAQVSGRNTVDWNRRLEFDVKYVENLSLINDLRILGRTLAVVLFGSGVSVDVDSVESRLDEERRVSSPSSTQP